MSRVSVLESLYSKKKSALEFNYDNLWAPPIMSLLSQDDINELIRIATSLRYNGKIETKYKLIDKVMNARGFRKAHSGTNRVVYNFLEDTRFVAKIAVDKIGMKDTPAEFVNQEYFKPFCCRIFEVHPSGIIGFVERVNPISSMEEFLSIADDVFNMIVTKIVGKYVVDDIGSTKPFNFGTRMNGFGPVILDFPYAYELDGRKLQCNKMNMTPFGNVPCGGEIDYDAGFNYLVCTKCGRKYQARDLANENEDILILNNEGSVNTMSKVRIVTPDGKIVLDDATSTKTYITKEEYNSYISNHVEFKPKVKVGNIRTKKRKSSQEIKNNMYTQLVMDIFAAEANQPYTPFKDLLGNTETVKVGNTIRKTVKEEEVTDHSDIDNIVSVGKIIEDDKVIMYTDEPEYNIVEDSVDSIIEDDVEEDIIEDNIIEEAVDKIVDALFTGDITEDEATDQLQETVDNLVKDNLSAEDNIEEPPQETIDVGEQQELNLEEFTIGETIKDDEPDYSKWEPEDDLKTQEENNTEDEVDYSEYIKKIKSNKKKDKKTGIKFNMY